MIKAQDLDLTQVILPGDRLMWGQSVAEPQTLIARLIEQRGRLGGRRGTTRPRTCRQHRVHVLLRLRYEPPAGQGRGS